jgi:hypothetical protein
MKPLFNTLSHKQRSFADHLVIRLMYHVARLYNPSLTGPERDPILKLSQIEDPSHFVT